MNVQSKLADQLVNAFNVVKEAGYTVTVNDLGEYTVSRGDAVIASGVQYFRLPHLLNNLADTSHVASGGILPEAPLSQEELLGANKKYLGSMKALDRGVL